MRQALGDLSDDGNLGGGLLQVPDVDNGDAQDGDRDGANAAQKQQSTVPLAEELEEEQDEQPRYAHQEDSPSAHVKARVRNSEEEQNEGQGYAHQEQLHL